jgi:hypothetical protein
VREREILENKYEEGEEQFMMRERRSEREGDLRKQI